MQIVSMTAEHVSRLAELEKLCFSEPWSEKGLTEEIDNPAACFLVAMQQDEVLGYGGMHTVRLSAALCGTMLFIIVVLLSFIEN